MAILKRFQGNRGVLKFVLTDMKNAWPHSPPLAVLLNFTGLSAAIIN